MILDWPATLPRPERESWQVQPMEARRRRTSETGPPAYRRRFSSVPKTVTMSLILSRSLREVFDRFFEIDCAQGSLLFRMADADAGQIVLSLGRDEVELEPFPPGRMTRRNFPGIWS